MKKLLLLSLLCISFAGLAKEVLIQKDFKSVNVIHNGEPVDLQRNQDRSNNIMKFYQGTWRGKIQPMQPFKPHPVETIAELEVIHYIDQISHGDDSILIVDSRPQSAVMITGMIPSAVRINSKQLLSHEARLKAFKTFGVKWVDNQWDFSQAKTLVLYCNGFWCGKSPRMIRKLLVLDYPADKLKYYRGGMQAWRSVGLTTVKK
ncbi:MAG: sulfurtransferase [Candidatus Thioglobus sp.]|nr:sulfurtransferase [Candidatus Thioglobus pontius]MBL6976777.1 sulfurtransferase [Candidatus Thioglobus sp.]MBL6984419.1 sulfurtransferase [Candidatus Thioglobus sp.]